MELNRKEVMKNIFLILAILFVSITTNAIAIDVADIQATRVGIVDGIVANVNAGQLGNGVTSYTYFNSFSDEGLTSWSLQFDLTATTLTFEASNDVMALGNSSATWTDITLVLSGGVYAAYTTTGSITVSNPLPWNRIRVKRVTTNLTNACELRLMRLLRR
jgi:hypothetical protein